MVRPAAEAGESDLRPSHDSAERPFVPTSSVADRGRVGAGGAPRAGASPAGRGRSRSSASASGPRPTSIVVPAPGWLSHENVAPTRSARARMPASPRWPSGTVAGSKPLPSSSTRSRTPPSTGRDLDPDLPGGRVLDDVVERLLGDPVEHLLGRQRQPILEVALDDDRQPEPALQRRRVGLERADEAVLLEVARPKLEDQRAHLGEGLALELAQLAELARAPPPGRVSSSISTERDTRVIENSAWVTESCSSRARCARSSPAASSPAWRRSSRLEPDLVADVARRALDAGEPPVDV